MAESLKHPWDQSLYTDCEDGTVRVDQTDGTWGRFDSEGHWVEGPLKIVDPEFGRWLISGWTLKQNTLAEELRREQSR
jgi:hypothetical protein